MKVLFVLTVGVFTLLSSEPVYALQDGRQLFTDCSRDNAYSDGFCEGFIAGVVSAHLSPWVISLQKGRTYFCIPGDVTFKQMAKIVEKYLADNPDHHRYRADNSIWTAATEAFPCPSK